MLCFMLENIRVSVEKAVEVFCIKNGKTGHDKSCFETPKCEN